MMSPEIKKARDTFLNNAYGKFDRIASIIPKELLELGKPRRVKEWMVEVLEIPLDKINTNSLNSWFFRIRSMKGYMPSKNDRSNVIDWKDFQPSEINRDDKSESSGIILKKVNPH